MTVHRLCRREHAATAFTGEGSRRYSARWHTAGTPVVYTAGSLESAMLETLVHVRPDRVPASLVRFEAEVPDELILPVERFEALGLHPDWREKLGYTRFCGDEWADRAASVALSVPSAVSPTGRNVLLNPTHPDFDGVVPGPPAPFQFDPRLLPPAAEV